MLSMTAPAQRAPRVASSRGLADGTGGAAAPPSTSATGGAYGLAGGTGSPDMGLFCLFGDLLPAPAANLRADLPGQILRRIGVRQRLIDAYDVAARLVGAAV